MPSAPTDRSTADGASGSWPRVALAAVTLVATAVLAWFLVMQMLSWSPATPMGLLADFAARLKDDPEAARRMLGPAAVFDLEPVSEDEAERRAADFYLRAKGLKVIDVLEGVPDGQGKQVPTPGKYTLVTKGLVTTPPQRLKTKTGVDDPRHGNLANPDVIVEIRDGKIVALRTELPMRP
jgi:hypothetical protein